MAAKKKRGQVSSRAKRYANIDQDHPITELEKRFVAEYCADTSDATAAAIRAGASPRSATVWAHDLIHHKPNTRKAIAEKLSRYFDRLDITGFDVLRRLRDIAMGDITDVVSWTGKTITLTESANLSKEARSLISSITEVTRADGGTELRIKMRDSMAALNVLCKYFGVLNSSRQAPQLPMVEQIRAVRAIKDGNLTPVEAALDLEAAGVPLPDTLKILLSRSEGEEPDDEIIDLPTPEQMWDRRQERIEEIRKQREGLPAKREEVAALKIEMGDADAFSPKAMSEGKA